MLHKTYNLLRKIAAEKATKLPVPTPEFVLDVLGKTESGYDRYTKDDFNDRYIRTKIRGTYGDPRVPKKKQTSSTAYGPWQITAARSADIAKYDPEYAKLHNSKLAAMYAEMARTGMGGYVYDRFKKTGKLPKGFSGNYVAAYDYGGHPFKVDAKQHAVVRGGLLNYITKHMIPQAKNLAGADAEKQWKALAAMHHLGHATPTAAEGEKFNKYWSMLQPNIALMQKNRAAWKQKQLNMWKQWRKEYGAKDPKTNPMLPIWLHALDRRVVEFSQPGY